MEEIIQTSTSVKFMDFDLPDFLTGNLEKGNIIHPSPVQEKSLPHSLEGKDILASAQTGTGKTLAFLLPIITRMMQNSESNCLIMAPTRELAMQVNEAAFRLLNKDIGIKTISLIGGEPIKKQIFQLKSLEEGAVRNERKNDRRGKDSRFVRNQRFTSYAMPTGGNGIHKSLIIVGTPGRIKDHLLNGNIKLDKAHFLVLDETDRMLELGFKDDIEEIIGYMPPKEERQTLMFSATIPKNIAELSKKYLNDPVRVDIEKKPENAPKITQEIIKYVYSRKLNLLTEFLNANEGSAIIFVKTKMGAEDLAAKLANEGLLARAIHGDLKQKEREFVIKSMKGEKIRIMVATDVAARGIHIPHIRYVINYDLPQCKEDYIHRIGRTGRAGEEGRAITFVNQDDRAEGAMANIYMAVNDSLDNKSEAAKTFARNYSAGKRSRGYNGGFRGRSENEGFRGRNENESFRGRSENEGSRNFSPRSGGFNRNGKDFRTGSKDSFSQGNNQYNSGKR